MLSQQHNIQPAHHVIFDKIYHLAKIKYKSQLAAELLNADAGVNVVKDHMSPIMLLAKEGDVESVEFLINNFIANPNHAVIGYALAGHVKLVEKMLRSGADIGCAIFGFARAKNVELVDSYLVRAKKEDAGIRRALSGYAYANHLNEMYALIRRLSLPDGFQSLDQAIKNDILLNYTMGGHTDIIDTFLRLGAEKFGALYGLAYRGNRVLVDALLASDVSKRDLGHATEGYAYSLRIDEVENLLSCYPHIGLDYPLHGYVRSGMFSYAQNIRKRSSLSADAAFIYARGLYFDKLDEVLKAGDAINDCIASASGSLSDQRPKMMPDGFYCSNAVSVLRLLSLVNNNGLRNYLALDLQNKLVDAVTGLKPRAVKINSIMSKYHLNFPQAEAWLDRRTPVLLMQVTRKLHTALPQEIVLLIAAEALDLSNQDMNDLLKIYLNTVPKKLYEEANKTSHARFFSASPTISSDELLQEQKAAADRYNRRINLLDIDSIEVVDRSLCATCVL